MKSSSVPQWLTNAVFARVRGGGLLGGYKNGVNTFNDPDALEDVSIEDAQVMTAKIDGSKYYRLLLDLDVDHFYSESSSGNGHLVIDVEMSREEHDLVMETLASVGVLQQGYAEGSKIKRQGAALRLPWVKKGEDKSLREQKS